jgi:HEAT repeat protein
MVTDSRLLARFSPRRLKVLAVALVAGVALFIGANSLIQRRARERWTVAITDPSMVTIRNLVAKGDLSQAASKLNATYRFDQEPGLIALRQFSLIVLERGLKEPDLFDRCYAASALAEGGQNEALQMLANTFQTDPDLSVKMAVADGLGEDGDRKAVAILQHLYYHGEMLDRRFIVNALASATDPSAIAVLSDAARQHDPTLRAGAFKALGRLGNRDAVPLLKLALAKGQAFDRVTAAQALLQLGDNSGVSALRATLNNHSEGNARAMAAVALGYAHDPALVPVLRQALSDDNIDVRLGAAAALTHYNDPGGIAYLRGAIRDQDQVTRRHAAQLFDDMAFNAAHPILVLALSSSDSDVQLAAVKTLGTAGGDPEVELLGVLLRNNKDPITRADIAWSLGRIGSPNGIMMLLAMVQETDPAVRYTAADGLDHTAMHLLGGTRLGSR